MNTNTQSTPEARVGSSDWLGSCIAGVVRELRALWSRLTAPYVYVYDGIEFIPVRDWNGAVMAFHVKVAEENNIRVRESDFAYGEIRMAKNDNRQILFSGRAALFFDNLLKLDKRRRTRSECVHNDGSPNAKVSGERHE